MKKALGLIELVGKAASVEAMDAAAKAANIELTGLENSRGGGRMMVKLTGEVSAVIAAVGAAAAAVERMGGTVFASKIIARPSDALDKILDWNQPEEKAENLQTGEELTSKTTEKIAEEPAKERVLRQPVCNLCQDPNCTRVRGEVKIKCIHYNELIKK